MKNRDGSRCADRKRRVLAAERLAAGVEDVEFRDGAFRIVGTDRAVALLEQ